MFLISLCFLSEILRLWVHPYISDWETSDAGTILIFVIWNSNVAGLSLCIWNPEALR